MDTSGSIASGAVADPRGDLLRPESLPVGRRRGPVGCRPIWPPSSSLDESDRRGPVDHGSPGFIPPTGPLNRSDGDGEVGTGTVSGFTRSEAPGREPPSLVLGALGFPSISVSSGLPTTSADPDGPSEGGSWALVAPGQALDRLPKSPTGPAGSRSACSSAPPSRPLWALRRSSLRRCPSNNPRSVSSASMAVSRRCRHASAWFLDSPSPARRYRQPSQPSV